MPSMQPLVATPQPYNGETLLAFILRVAESNGHPSPGLFLRYAEVSDDDLRTIQIPLEPVAAALGRQVEDIEHLRYVKDGPLRHGGVVWLNGHRVPTLYTRLRTTPICVDCVEEQGFISGYWHLRHAVACPRHGRMPLKACPGCGRAMSWFRRGLLRCSCGYRFLNAPAQPEVDQRMQGLLEVLRRRIMNQALHDDPGLITAGYPLDHLSGMEVASLLGLIERLGRVARENGLPAPYPEVANDWTSHAVAIADAALRDWPSGFYGFLDSLAVSNTREHASGPVTHFGLRRRHESLWSRLFKDGPSDDYAFLRRAFTDWALARPEEGLVDRRHERPAYWEQTGCGLGELAERSGLDPRKARNLVEAGVIDAQVFHSEGATRYYCDLRRLAVWRPEVGECYSERRAGKAIGLPVSVLRALKQHKLFHFGCVCAKNGQYHEFDLERLSDALADAASPASAVDWKAATPVSLAEVVRWKRISPASKAEAVSAVIHKELVPLQGGTADPATIILDGEAVRELAGESWAQESGLRRSPEAAAMIGCDHGSLLSLIEDGHIDAETTSAGYVVIESSLCAFAKRYIACSRVAKHIDTSSWRLQKDLAANEVELLKVSRRSKAKTRNGTPSLQAFMRREDLPYVHASDIPLFATS